MKYIFTTTLSLGLLLSLIGCGEGSITPLDSPTQVEKESTQMTTKVTPILIAKDNTLKQVVKSFRAYQIKVFTDKRLEENAVSNDTFAVYGEIDGENTASLLKLNSNYPLGTKVTIKVFDRESRKLIGKSEPQLYEGNAINFNVIPLDYKN